MGCGSFARVFAETVSGLRGEIGLYFASRDLARAREYASQFNGLDAFGSYASAAADPRVEAVYICTPHHLHLEHVALAASQGKHVLVEKPIAGNLADAEANCAPGRVRRDQSDGGGELPVPELGAESQRFGEPGAGGTSQTGPATGAASVQPSRWRNQAGLNGGGVLIDGGIHKASVLAYLSGRPNQVYAQRLLPGQPGLEAEDGIVVMTRTKDGVTGVINHSWSVAPTTPRPWVSILGAKSTLYFELGRPWLKILDRTSEELLDLPDEVRGLVPMVREFHQSIIEGREPAMSGAQGIADLTLVLKAYESLELGKPVPVD